MKGIRIGAYILSAIFLIFLCLGFSDIPYHMKRGLSCIEDQRESSFDYIIHFSGNGMPSSDELLRCYYTAQAALKDTNAIVYIVQPAPTKMDEKLNKTKQELLEKGIDENRILYEIEGINSHTQVGALSNKLEKDHHIAIITTPFHMFRLKKCFEKAGLKNISCLPTMETSLSNDVLISTKKNSKVPAGSIDLRYNFWNYLKFEISAMREYVAIAYYRLNGWI